MTELNCVKLQTKLVLNCRNLIVFGFLFFFYTVYTDSISKISGQPTAVMSGAFYPLVLASQVAVVTVLILAGYWTGHFLGGFAWDGSAQEFNLHPLLMILGLVFFYGDGKRKKYINLDLSTRKLYHSSKSLVYHHGTQHFVQVVFQ